MKELNELVELAKRATPGKWWIDSHGHSMVSFIDDSDMEVVFVTKSEAMGESKRHDDTGNLSHWRNDNDATFIAAANPATILAIAEAFRALEQRAEAAEAENKRLARNYQSVINQHMPRTGDGCDEGWSRVIEARELQDKLEAAEAKLAELEKPQPMAYRWESPVNGKICYDGIKPLGVISQPLYLRPAPAVSLAELVPDESALADKHIEWLSTLQRPMFSDEDWEELTLYTWLAFRDSARVQRAAILRNIEEANK